MLILLLVVITDTLYCPLENNLCEGQIFYFYPSVWSFFFLNYFSGQLLFLSNNLVEKNLVIKRWYFLTGGQVISRDENWGGWVKKSSADTVCTASHPKMSWDTLGGVAGRKMVGSFWVHQAKDSFNSRSGGNCPRSRWPQPCHRLSLLSSSLCCRGLLTHLQVGK